jgi:hypothetical protein
MGGLGFGVEGAAGVVEFVGGAGYFTEFFGEDEHFGAGIDVGGGAGEWEFAEGQELLLAVPFAANGVGDFVNFCAGGV